MLLNFLIFYIKYYKNIYILSLCYNFSSEKFDFFDPFRIFNNKFDGHSDEVMQTFIQNKMYNHPKKYFLGPRLNV